MNREIKFRGKSNHPESFSYGDFVFGSLITRGELAPLINVYDENGSRDVRVDPETVGQFTGVKDINGREIYEGDIVRVRVTNDRFKKNPRFSNGVVTFNKYNGGWANGCYYQFLPGRMEVIGNIHDNPNLPEGGEQ